jgi:hypothetical protein
MEQNNMVQKPDQIPTPVLIQTGNRETKNLIPIHEGPGNIIEISENYCPTEAFQPPPFIPEEEPIYQGNFAELTEPVVNSGGTRFDPKSNMSSMRQKSNYHIIDLFWMINPKLGVLEMPREEAHFCQISFNIDFGNIKITLFKIPNGALQGHVLFLMSLMRLTSGTIYPSSLFKLQYEGKKLERGNKPIEFTCLEQLVYKTDEPWQSNRPVCTFRIDDTIALTITDKNSGIYYYEFSGWQKEALLHSAEFATDKGYILTGQQNINGFKE